MILTQTGFIATPVTPVETKVTTVETVSPDGVLLSEPVKSKFQPLHTGHPFVIFAPEAITDLVNPTTLELLKSRILKVRKGQPTFFRTDVPMLRIATLYGDVKTATRLYAALHQLMPDYVFKNWQS